MLGYSWSVREMFYPVLVDSTRHTNVILTSPMYVQTLAEERELSRMRTCISSKNALSKIPNRNPPSLHSIAVITNATLLTLRSKRHAIVGDAVSERKEELRVLIMERKTTVAVAVARPKRSC
jgi:hypothetical protein